MAESFDAVLYSRVRQSISRIAHAKKTVWLFLIHVWAIIVEDGILTSVSLASFRHKRHVPVLFGKGSYLIEIPLLCQGVISIPDLGYSMAQVWDIFNEDGKIADKKIVAFIKIGMEVPSVGMAVVSVLPIVLLVAILALQAMWVLSFIIEVVNGHAAGWYTRGLIILSIDKRKVPAYSIVL